MLRAREKAGAVLTEGSQTDAFDSVRKKIKDVTQHAAVGLINFRVFALRAGDRRELLGLHIEDLGEKPARRAELANVV